MASNGLISTLKADYLGFITGHWQEAAACTSNSVPRLSICRKYIDGG